jgi:hypothetical protein
MGEEKNNSPYLVDYYQHPIVGREVGQPVSSYAEIEKEAKLSHDDQIKNMAIEYAKKTGNPVKESIDMFHAQWNAEQAHKKADLEEKIKQADYSRDLAEMRSYMAKINTRKLNAQEGIDEVAQKWSFLAGSLDPNIAKQYESIVASYNKAHESYRAGIQKVLPRGVGVDEIADENNDPDYRYASELGFSTEEKRSQLREGRAMRQIEKKAKEAEELQKLKFGQSVSPEAIEAQRKKDENKAKIKKEYGIVDPVEQLVALAKAGQVPTQQSTKPAATPAPTPSPTPEATPSITPLPQSKPSTTTGKTQPREGQIFIQKGKKYQYNSGEYIPVD